MKGQALTSLIIIMFVGMAVTAAAITLVDINATITGNFENVSIARNVAESGVEDALIKLLRNPSFSGETLNIQDGIATVTITGTNPVIITSKGYSANHVYTLETQVSFNSGVMVVDSWKEL